MKTMNIIRGMALCVPFLLASCTNNEELVSVGDEKQVLFTVDEFKSATTTRTTVDPTKDYAITWASGDAIGIFPREGYQEPFVIPADQVGQATASFDGGYWALKEGLFYNAYYPIDKANFESADMKTQIPVTYLGQEQDGTTCGIGAYDYTYSDWMVAPESGSVNFKFHHIGAFVIFTLQYPVTGTYTELTLSADENVIPTTGTYDLTANKYDTTKESDDRTADEVNFVADEDALTNSITLRLKNCEGTAGETGTFYMMLPPMDLSGRELTVSLKCSTTNKTYFGPIVSKPQSFAKSMMYQLNVNLPSIPTKEQGINLGGNILWAPYNVGASSPEECGDYFAWGEVKTKSNYTNATYKFASSDKYYYNSEDYTEIQPDDDVAQVEWGNGWRMPTLAEIQSIIDNCTWEFTQKKGVNGYNVTYKQELWDYDANKFLGYSYNTIFLPAAGYYEGTSIQGAGTYGYYWSGNYNTENPNSTQWRYEYAHGLFFHQGGKDYSGSDDTPNTQRYYGFTVRPVISKFYK